MAWRRKSVRCKRVDTESERTENAFVPEPTDV